MGKGRGHYQQGVLLRSCSIWYLREMTEAAFWSSWSFQELSHLQYILVIQPTCDHGMNDCARHPDPGVVITGSESHLNTIAIYYKLGV